MVEWKGEKIVKMKTKKIDRSGWGNDDDQYPQTKRHACTINKMSTQFVEGDVFSSRI